MSLWVLVFHPSKIHEILPSAVKLYNAALQKPSLLINPLDICLAGALDPLNSTTSSCLSARSLMLLKNMEASPEFSMLS